MTEAAVETKPAAKTTKVAASNGTDPLALHKLVLTYFKYDHLNDRLAGFSKPFHAQAAKIVRATKAQELEPTESLVALRKLLEAKDACVRAAL
jgi:hypothetical protein